MKQSGFGIASLILGIIGMLLSCILIGIVPCVISVIFAIMALLKKDKKHGIAVAGLVCSIIGIIVFVFMVVMVISTPSTDDEKNQDKVEVVEQAEANVDDKDGNAGQEAIITSEPTLEPTLEPTATPQPTLTPEPTATPEPTEAPEVEYADWNVKYISHEIGKDYAGNEVLIVYFEFTNNSDDNQAFAYAFSDVAFQNGIELEPTYWEVNEETENADKEVQPGTTVKVATSYGISDKESPVTVELSPFNIWSDKVLMSLELNLK